MKKLLWSRMWQRLGGASFGTSNDSYIGAYGIGGGTIESMSSCKNTGKIMTTFYLKL